MHDATDSAHTKQHYLGSAVPELKAARALDIARTSYYVATSPRQGLSVVLGFVRGGTLDLPY